MDLESLILDFITGGALVAGAMGLAVLAGPLLGGVFAGAPIRAGVTIFLAGVHDGAEFASEMTRGAVFSMIGNIFFIGALYLALPRFGLYRGFLLAGVVFLVAIGILVKLWT